MEIFPFQDQYHVIEEGWVYASFNHESEAKAFQESCEQGAMKEMTDYDLIRLLKKEELLEGKRQEPLSEDQRKSFEFVRTGA